MKWNIPVPNGWSITIGDNTRYDEDQNPRSHPNEWNIWIGEEIHYSGVTNYQHRLTRFSATIQKRSRRGGRREFMVECNIPDKNNSDPSERSLTRHLYRKEDVERVIIGKLAKMRMGL